MKRNKGFTLPEFLLVFMISAVLIIAIVHQILLYAEKSKIYADKQLAESIKTSLDAALQNPYLEEDDSPEPMERPELLTSISLTAKFGMKWKELLGSTPEEVEQQLTSKAYRGQKIYYQITTENHVIITIPSAKDSKEEEIRLE